jgi:hypothetical protein
MRIVVDLNRCQAHAQMLFPGPERLPAAWRGSKQNQKVPQLFQYKKARN